ATDEVCSTRVGTRMTGDVPTGSRRTDIELRERIVAARSIRLSSSSTPGPGHRVGRDGNSFPFRHRGPRPPRGGCPDAGPATFGLQVPGAVLKQTLDPPASSRLGEDLQCYFNAPSRNPATTGVIS